MIRFSNKSVTRNHAKEGSSGSVFNRDNMPQETNEQKCLPLHIDNLPESFYQKALEELNETPETRQIELQKLKDLLSSDLCMSNIEFEVDYLHQFLRHSKYDSKRAFQYLKKCKKLRENYKVLFQNVQDEKFRGNSSVEFFSMLPYRSPDGCPIFLNQMGKWNPSEFSFEDFQRLMVLMFLQELRCPMTQISGFKIIHDFKDTVKHLSYCTPQSIRLFYNAGFNSLPVRYKEIHVINPTTFMSILWSVLKHFLSEKMRKRFIFHSTPEDLLNYFPKSIIPTEYGGSLNDYHDKEMIRKMNREHEDFPPGGLPNYF